MIMKVTKRRSNMKKQKFTPFTKCASAGIMLVGGLGAAYVATAGAQTTLDRTMLPIPEPQIPHSTVFDARNATPPERFQVKAPAGAPNVLIVLIDDFGFGQASTFGGPIPMPTAERLANGGLKYNQFHTAALSAPTRTALLSGRNHHTNNMGSITETATAFPGNTAQRPDNVAPLAMMLRYNGSWAERPTSGLRQSMTA
jgi:hypothetical protein